MIDDINKITNSKYKNNINNINALLKIIEQSKIILTNEEDDNKILQQPLSSTSALLSKQINEILCKSCEDGDANTLQLLLNSSSELIKSNINLECTNCEITHYYSAYDDENKLIRKEHLI